MSGLGNADRGQVMAALADLQRRIGDLPAYDYRNRAPYDAAVAELVSHLSTRRTARATVRAIPPTYAISMLGFRATSTGGIVAACRNWIAQVRAKAGVV